MTTSVNDKAMLARLSISRWGASKHDKSISEQVAQQHQAKPEMGRYTKRLVAKETLEEIRQIATQARHHHYEHTLPWLDDGARILPAASYFDYMNEQNSLKAKFDHAVDDFARVYPQVVDDARLSLGGLFDHADYPDQSDISEKFSMEIDIVQLPSAEDFRVNISADEQEKIRSAIQERVDQGVEGAIKSVWDRVHDAAQRMMERLENYSVDTDGKVQGTFRDSLVGNIRDLVDVLPALNITNSNALEDMRNRLEQDLCQIDAQTLRDDPDARKKVAKAAAQIVEDINVVMA